MHPKVIRITIDYRQCHMPIGIQSRLIGMSLSVVRRKRHQGTNRRQAYIGSGIKSKGRGHVLVQIGRPDGVGMAPVAFVIATHTPTVLSPIKATPIHFHEHRVGQMGGHHHGILFETAAEQVVVLERTNRFCTILLIEADAVHIETVITHIGGTIFDIFPTEYMLTNGDIKLMFSPSLLARAFHFLHPVKIKTAHIPRAFR